MPTATYATEGHEVEEGLTDRAHLGAIPFATLCIECAEDAESKNESTGHFDPISYLEPDVTKIVTRAINDAPTDPA